MSEKHFSKAGKHRPLSQLYLDHVQDRQSREMKLNDYTKVSRIWQISESISKKKQVKKFLK